MDREDKGNFLRAVMISGMGVKQVWDSCLGVRNLRRAILRNFRPSEALPEMLDQTGGLG
jgi:hypothetical protein